MNETAATYQEKKIAYFTHDKEIQDVVKKLKEISIKR